MIYEESWVVLLECVDTQGSILALYQIPDLTETQPDAHKYIPLFLPLCACQLGGEVGLFWVFSVFQPTPHVAHKRAALTSWNAYVFLLLVVCHGGDLLTAAQLQSSFCIMETCLSWHPWINQLESLLHELCCHPVPVPIQDCKRESWLQTLLKWAVKPALTDVRISAHMITFGHTGTHWVSVLKFADISRILHVSHQLSIFRKNKHMPFKKLIKSHLHITHVEYKLGLQCETEITSTYSKGMGRTLALLYWCWNVWHVYTE